MNHPRSDQDILDLSGKFCPEVVLAVRARMEAMPAGHALHVWSTDPLSEIDIPLYAMRAGIEVIRRWREADGFRFILIRKDATVS